MRSLKIEIPSAEELDRARDRILKQFAAFDSQREKIRTIYPLKPSKSTGKIFLTRSRLRFGRTNGLSCQKSGFTNASLRVAPKVPMPGTSPAIEDEITRDLAAAASKLLGLLRNSDLSPFTSFVFGPIDIWNEFIERLERLAASPTGSLRGILTQQSAGARICPSTDRHVHNSKIDRYCGWLVPQYCWSA